MAIVSLASLIPPPAVPNQVGTLAQWQAVEEDLGVTLPTDFREFVLAYGSGYLGRFYFIWNPFTGAEFTSHVRLICGYERQLQQEFPKYSPFPIYPEHPGFLPWGSDGNGNYYGWLTDGEADQWPVLSNSVRGDGYRLHHCNMTEYLAGVFRGEIIPLAGGYPGPDDFVFQG